VIERFIKGVAMYTSIRVATLSFLILGAANMFAATGDVAVETTPGAGAAAVVVKGSGTIKAIDAATRTVTILGESGEEMSIVAGPHVKNFPQLKVGQRVNAEYAQALTLELKSGSTEPISRTLETVTGEAMPGQLPAGAVGQRLRIVAEVLAVNSDAKTVTLKGPERTIDLTINDPKQLALVKVGDRIEAIYVEATALAVSPAE
jgi:Cu/Ag efflux protein CusF